MKNNPLVSVLCLVYNHEPYLRQCLDGFVMQKTDFGFEAIVHDDASTDNSAAILREYAEKYPDIIKPIYEVENQYRKGTLRAIMDNAVSDSSKYIALCEGDDYWTDPHKLQKQVDFLESHPDYGMCFTNFNILRENGQLEKSVLGQKGRPYEFSNVGEWIKSASYMGPMTWLVRKDIWAAQYNINSIDGTFVYFAHYLANSKVKCLVNETTAVYRLLKSSASHSNDLSKQYQYKKGIHETQLRMIEYYQEKIPDPNGLLSEINQKYYQRFLFHIVANGDQQELEKAINCSNKSWPLVKRLLAKCAKIQSLSSFIQKLVKRYLENHNKIKE